MGNVICDCGEKLSLSSHQTISYNYRLKKDGTPYKKPYEKFNGDSEGGELFCEACSNVYKAMRDSEKGTYYKGELMD